ncbi:ABC transporter ATP-binding protein [Dongia sp.]|uniref:ABC transporter ATP-binding protein n=1 Tax=Dongia sp. TaxID=1977262 RepID=UPI0035B310C3
MADIALVGIGHRYGQRPYALEPLDVTFQQGRTYALLGPSGCGKTTMLNIVSGLLRPSDGRILIDGRDMTDVKTAARNIAQVFQFPVIYSAKSVADNLAFPLICRRWPTAKVRARVEEIAALLGLDPILGKRARNLTADQKQLISLGRGLVRDDVAALLMDEPLTVIDPQSKFALRRKIKAVIEQARLTVVYVTHDQNEAMTFAHEVLVMKNGTVVQQGTPDELFERPKTTYVGYFIGSPAMNFLDLVLKPDGLWIEGTKTVLPISERAGLTGRKLQLGIRPEHLSLAGATEQPLVTGPIVTQQDCGSSRIALVQVGETIVRVKVGRDDVLPEGMAALSAPRDKWCLYADGALVGGT